MPTFIRPAKRITEYNYSRVFDDADQPGSGFGFPCDEQGRLLRLSERGQPLNESARANYAACLQGTVNGRQVVDRGVRRYENRYTQPAIIACENCSRPVVLSSDTVLCERCGRYYNLSGQSLSDPSNWGEETGETAADILGPGGGCLS
jgi:hypothetical protein